MLRPPDNHERGRSGLEQSARMLDRFLRILLGIVAVAILMGSTLIMLTMDTASRSQGGRLYVAVAAVLLLGAVDTQFARLARRRRPLSLIEPAEYSRYRVLSCLLLLLSTLALVGLALLLP